MVPVQASGTAFAPANVMVSVGDSVLWIFNDAPHTVTAEDRSFDVTGHQAGSSTSVRFLTAGSYRYYCQYHGGPGGVGMSGTVQVVPASPTTTSIPSTTTSTWMTTTTTTRALPSTTTTTAPAPKPTVRPGRAGPTAGDGNGVSIVSSWEWEPYGARGRYVAGELVNDGSRPVTVTEVTFDMLDSGGRLLATTSASARGFVLQPGGRAGFERDLSPPEGYATLTARVSSNPASVSTSHAYSASITNRYTDQYGTEHIVGQVRNGSPGTADQVWVYATFFDADGHPAGSDLELIDAAVAPGATASFEFRRSADRPRYATEHLSAEGLTWATFFTGPDGSGAPAQPPAPPPGPSGRFGYWMVSAGGRVYAFGDAAHLGDAQGALGNASAVDIEPTPSGNGYRIADSAGRVFNFGDATAFPGLAPGVLAAGEQVTSLSATRSGVGYWLFTSRGRVLAFGDAPHLGDVSRVALNGPVLDSVVTPSGRGYYMVASDGGIFSFGDASFYGSMGGQKLNAPVQSLVPDSDGEGYWLVASDGGIFAFQAPFQGSMGHVRLNRPVSGMVRAGSGYLMVGEDGGIFDFSGNADSFKGSLGGNPPARPIRAVAVLEGR